MRNFIQFSLIVYYHKYGLIIHRVVVEYKAKVVHPIFRVDNPVVLLFAKKDTAGRILDGVSGVHTNPLTCGNILPVHERKITFELRGVTVVNLIDTFWNHTTSLFESIAEIAAIYKESAKYCLALFVCVFLYV